jgi:hypothetical protein
MTPPRRERHQHQPQPEQQPQDLKDPERFYIITSGVSGTERLRLDLVTMVVARRGPTPTLQQEQATVLRLCRAPLSIAELSAYLGLPFSVVTALLTELLEHDLIETQDPIARSATPDRSLLEAVMHGLQRL